MRIAALALLASLLVADPASAATPCPDPVAAQHHIHSIIPTYDYNPSASPSDLAEGRTVAVGTITGAGRYGTAAWFRIGDHVAVFDDEPLEYADPVDPAKLVGLRSLAIIGERFVAIEGWWLACREDERAVPGIYAGGADGWPAEPTIDQLQALIADPPRVTHGAVIRRSGVGRTYGSDRTLQLEGTLTRSGRCLFVGGRPVVWPPGTRWRPTQQAVTLADGRTFPLGRELALTGGEIEAPYVRYWLGWRAGNAIESCTPTDVLTMAFDADVVVASASGS